MSSLLLHTCCAPCLLPSMDVLLGRVVWERVLLESPKYDVFVWPYNPNIADAGEYDRRKSAIVDVLERGYPEVRLVEDESEREREAWRRTALFLREERERGRRCTFCYGFRLYRAFLKAEQLQLQAVATTLTLSPLKNTALINQIGLGLAKRFGIAYVVSDFKKQNGVNRSRDLCVQYGVYRQGYCGCEFSHVSSV